MGNVLDLFNFMKIYSLRNKTIFFPEDKWRG